MNKTSLKRILISAAVLAVIGGLLAWMNPIRGTLQRLLILCSVLLPVLSLLLLLPKTRPVQFTLGGIVAAIMLWLVSTISYTPVDQRRFAASMQALEGTAYVWGGECSNGIDCSGLIRYGLQDYYLRSGRIGAFMRLWFFDCPAKDLGRRYQDIFEDAGTFSSIPSIPAEALAPGAIAVTQSGVHVLAYIGNARWIQASPGARAVIIKSMDEEGVWFKAPVRLFRLKK